VRRFDWNLRTAVDGADMGLRATRYSNFARPGFECRTTEVTGVVKPYLGSARTRTRSDGTDRWSRITPLSMAIATCPFEKTPATPCERFFPGLRLAEGIRLRLVPFANRSSPLAEGCSNSKGPRYGLTNRGVMSRTKSFADFVGSVQD